jgi:hypothetical protein
MCLYSKHSCPSTPTTRQAEILNPRHKRHQAIIAAKVQNVPHATHSVRHVTVSVCVVCDMPMSIARPGRESPLQQGSTLATASSH